MQKKELTGEQKALQEQRNEKLRKSSAQVSNIVRQLIFAGIAIIWLFKTIGKGGKATLEIPLVWALFMFASAIFVELLHYLIESLALKIYSCSCMLDKRIPGWIADLAWIFWMIKILLTIVAYIVIARHIVPMLAVGLFI